MSWGTSFSESVMQGIIKDHNHQNNPVIMIHQRHAGPPRGALHRRCGRERWSVRNYAARILFHIIIARFLFHFFCRPQSAEQTWWQVCQGRMSRGRGHPWTTQTAHQGNDDGDGAMYTAMRHCTTRTQRASTSRVTNFSSVTVGTHPAHQSHSTLRVG